MTIFIILSVGGALLWASRWYYHDEELGFMSAHWLAEYRQDAES